MKFSSAAVHKMEAANKGGKGRGKSKNYSRFIYRVLRQGPQDSDVCLPREPERILCIAAEAACLSLYNKRRTITRREVESAVKSIASTGPHPLPGPAASD
ncbi:hypothetical protein GDO81_025017 [Engystomops pustulosus]|uniref:Histone H2B n=1 Tax=Engystomops pustulosus TaxID=76066 RepID=A0AAV6YN64_ENGPU|nr:hypothetical protein GDO81_025025 [Engystomops pustulosus]KAG8537135.1 hypothetical protein GDO81_025017 [Engystomops pustulosus]